MKIDIPERKKLVLETRFPVRWGDMDAMGHVNNAVYFLYL
jgi:acyl-CoA thioester hydrolase